MKRILIINGPNLNLLGKREQSVYGTLTMEEYLTTLQKRYASQTEISYYQSNVEGEIINALQAAVSTHDSVILNAGGYTHTSVAIADAVAAIASQGVPTVEVHISNILAREEYRHISLIAPRASGTITGFGMDSYRLAIEYLCE